MKRFSFVPGVLVILALGFWLAPVPVIGAEKARVVEVSFLDDAIRARHGLDYPPEVQPVKKENMEDVYSLLLKDGQRMEVKLLSVKPEGLRAMNDSGVFLIEAERLSEGAQRFFAHSGLRVKAAAGNLKVSPPEPPAAVSEPVRGPAQIIRPGQPIFYAADPAPPAAAAWHSMGQWKGMVYLANGEALRAVVDACNGVHLKFTVAGALRVVPLADLHPVTRGELGLGDAADVAAYQADLERRKLLAAQEAQQAYEDAVAVVRRQERLEEMQDRERARRAEAWARWQREQQTEALQRIAEEMELRRLQGR